MQATMPPRRRVTLAVSFGGTKIAAALVGLCTGAPAVICQTGRIEWREDPRWRPENPLESLLDLVATHVGSLLGEAELQMKDVSRIGLAWPGPGRYSEGVLSATFIPCDSQPVHQLLLGALRKQLRCSVDHLEVLSCLDVNARAQGEVRSPLGAFHPSRGDPQPSGVVLNIATGIAGAIVRNGSVFPELGPWGETYGQWGRYLLLKRTVGHWFWRPTNDGSVPEHGPDEVRFTQRCGGPALARRFSDRTSDMMRAGWKLSTRLARTPNMLPGEHTQRDLMAERALLVQITDSAYHDRDEIAQGFLEEVGADIGGAVRCLAEALGEGVLGTKLLLTGGIGEFFGALPRSSDHRDILIDAVRRTLRIRGMEIARSALGLEAEFLGFAV